MYNAISIDRWSSEHFTSNFFDKLLIFWIFFQIQMHFFVQALQGFNALLCDLKVKIFGACIVVDTNKGMAIWLRHFLRN